MIITSYNKFAYIFLEYSYEIDTDVNNLNTGTGYINVHLYIYTYIHTYKYIYSHIHFHFSCLVGAVKFNTIILSYNNFICRRISQQFFEEMCIFVDVSIQCFLFPIYYWRNETFQISIFFSSNSNQLLKVT